MTRPKNKFWFRVGAGRRRRRPKKVVLGKMITLRREDYPTAFSFWMRHFRSREVRMHGFAKFCEGQGYVSVPSLYPPIEEKAKP